MKDKYLCKDGITEKYDIRGQCIEGVQLLGMGLGYGSSLIHMAFDLTGGKNLDFTDFKEAIGGFVIGTGSFVLGRYLHKRNDEKKDIEIVKEGKIEPGLNRGLNDELDHFSPAPDILAGKETRTDARDGAASPARRGRRS